MSHKKQVAVVLCLVAWLPAVATAQSSVSPLFWLRADVRLLTDPAVQRDLKLNADQTARVQVWSRKLPDTSLRSSRQPSTDNENSLQNDREQAALLQKEQDEILTPDQQKRFRQIVLQERRKDSGLLAVIDESDVATALQPTSEQTAQWNALRLNFARESIKLGSDRDLESTRQKTRLLTETNEKAVALLTLDQQTRLKNLLGEPLQGELRSTRGFASNGDRGPSSGFQVGARTLGSLTLLYVTQKSVQDDLKLTPEQTAKVQQASGRDRFSGANVSPDILTPEQLERYRQIVLQNSQKSSGTIALLRYREIVELLKLTDEQKESARQIGEESLVSRPRGTSRTETGLAPPQQAGEAKLMALLTADQQSRLKDWLGTPFTGMLETAFGPTGPRTATLDSAILTLDIADKTVQDDLKLTVEQSAKLTELLNNNRRFVNPRTVASVLSAEQSHRLRQLQLQYLQRRSGDLSVLRYSEVVEPLQLADDQRKKLDELLTDEQRLTLSPSRFGVPTEEERAKASDSRKALNAKLQEILTTQQKDRLKATYGEPFKGEFPQPASTRSTRGTRRETAPST